MRLATFNILNGRSLADGQVDPRRLRDAVRFLDADVLGLQEVDRDQPRSGHVDLTAVAAEAMGAVDWRFVPAVSGTPGEGWRGARGDVPHGPAYGISLLSRVPVQQWHIERFPGLSVPAPVYVGNRRMVLSRDEPRVCVAAVVALDGAPLTVATTHLSYVPGWNALQLRRLVARLRPLPRPQVLLGDLNLPAGTARAITRWRSLADGPTFPAPEPRVQLDHVLATGDLPPVSSAEVPLLPLSDHRAVVVELTEAS